MMPLLSVPQKKLPKRPRDTLISNTHAIADAPGNPLRWILAASKVVGITQAPAVIECLGAQAVIADKGMAPTHSSRALMQTAPRR